VNEADVARAKRAGLVVMPWTVNDPAEWERFIGMGIEWLITDDPAALVDYLNST
jgi:glycerophosphoryl diester phosphodiesterase